MRSIPFPAHALSAACVLSVFAAASHAGVVATYRFNNSLAADEPGVAPLTAVDPLSTSGFTTAVVGGVSQTVYAFNGFTPADQQGGLTLDSTGLLASNSYSVQIVFTFINTFGSYRSVFDTANRQSDSHAYIGPAGTLSLYPAAVGSTVLADSTFHDIIFSIAPDGTTKGYVNGAPEFSVNTSILNISAENILSFFLDNNASNSQMEWSRGQVAFIRLFDGPLTDAQALDAYTNHNIPAPAGALLLAAGLAASRRRR